MTKSAIEKMVEWNKLERQKILNPGYLWGPARESDDARMGMIAAFCLMEKEARRLAAEEKSKPAPICVCIDEPHPLPELGTIKPAAVMCHECRTCALREGFPCNKPIKPAPVEARDKAYGECKNVGKTCRACHAEHCTTRVYHNPVEAKATAEGSLVPCQVNDFDNDGPCPHMNKDGTIPCAYIKKDCPSYRPASPAVEGLVRELRALIDGPSKSFNTDWIIGIEEILAKYDNAKGGK